MIKVIIHTTKKLNNNKTFRLLFFLMVMKNLSFFLQLLEHKDVKNIYKSPIPLCCCCLIYSWPDLSAPPSHSSFILFTRMFFRVATSFVSLATSSVM